MPLSSTLKSNSTLFCTRLLVGGGGRGREGRKGREEDKEKGEKEKREDIPGLSVVQEIVLCARLLFHWEVWKTL